MGEKGDTSGPNSELKAELVLTRLSSIENISFKKMFGGHGIFRDGKMFCIIDSKGNCFLKADESNRHLFENLGSEKHSRMPYFSVPDEILDKASDFLDLAQKSMEIGK